MHEGEVSARLGLAGYPSVGEATMVARDALLARDEEARTHFQHLSAWESVEALAMARDYGAPVSGEASPHHLLLTDEAVLSLDTRMKMNPPLRTERDRQAIIAGLREGIIECIATDHAPHAADEKDVPFEEAPMGTTGLESAFAAVYTGLVRAGILPLGLVIERFTAGARLMGLPTPEIAVGAPANLNLIDLEAIWQVGEAGYESRSSNCCFAGQRLNGRVLLTVAAGAVAYRERSFAVSAA
jgi:dihydroorotase